jgi:hypothetical protein
LQRASWGNIVESGNVVFLLQFAGTLAGAVGNEQDVISLQRHVRSFRLHDLLNVYRNLGAAIFAFSENLGVAQVSGRVRPFRGRQCLQHRDGTGILHNHADGPVYVAYDVNDAHFGD